MATNLAFEGRRFGGLAITRVALTGDAKLNVVGFVTPRSARYAATLGMRALRGRLDGQELRVVAPEDFILLKVLSTRDRDLEDARSVVRALDARLDQAFLDAEATTLAAEIADHDVAGRYRAVVSR